MPKFTVSTHTLLSNCDLGTAEFLFWQVEKKFHSSKTQLYAAELQSSRKEEVWC